MSGPHVQRPGSRHPLIHPVYDRFFSVTCRESWLNPSKSLPFITKGGILQRFQLTIQHCISTPIIADSNRIGISHPRTPFWLVYGSSVACPVDNLHILFYMVLGVQLLQHAVWSNRC